jgi:hypothetical protein
MQVDELSAKIEQSQAHCLQVQEHSARYKSSYLKNVAKPRRIQSAE